MRPRGSSRLQVDMTPHTRAARILLILHELVPMCGTGTLERQIQYLGMKAGGWLNDSSFGALQPSRSAS